MGGGEGPKVGPARARAGDDDQELRRETERLRRLLPALRQLLLIDTANRCEAFMWLQAAIARLPVTPTQQCRQLLRLLPGRSGDAGPKFAKQLLALLCERRPKAVGVYLADNSSMLRDFFRDNPKRTMLFFEHFSMSGEFNYGARALARFAFANRDTVWGELEWMGKHAQAPVTVVAKPHYFCELHVLRTVQNFADRVPEFWVSKDLKAEVESGDILALDTEFFVEELLRDLRAERPEVMVLLEDYLEQEAFAVLCNRLLPLVEAPALLRLVDGLTPLAKPLGRRSAAAEAAAAAAEGAALASPSAADMQRPEVVALAGVTFKHVDDMLLQSALACNGRSILQLMRDEDPPSTSSMTDLVLEDMGNDAAILHTIPNGAVCRHAAADWQTADHRLLLLLQVFLLRTKLHKAQFEKVTDMVAVLGLLGIASQPVQAELLPSMSPPRKRRKRSKHKHNSKHGSKSKSKGKKKSKKSKRSKGKSKKRRHSSSSDSSSSSGSDYSLSDSEGSIEEALIPGLGDEPGTGTSVSNGTAIGLKISTDGFAMVWSNTKELCDHVVEYMLQSAYEVVLQTQHAAARARMHAFTLQGLLDTR